MRDFQPEARMEQNCGVGKAQGGPLVPVEPKIVFSQALNKFRIQEFAKLTLVPDRILD